VIKVYPDFSPAKITTTIKNTDEAFKAWRQTTFAQRRKKMKGSGQGVTKE